MWYPTFQHSVDVMNVPFKPPWVTEIDSPAVFGVDGRGVERDDGECVHVQVPVQTQRRGGRKQVVFVVFVPLIVPVVVIEFVFVPVLALVRVHIIVFAIHRIRLRLRNSLSSWLPS